MTMIYNPAWKPTTEEVRDWLIVSVRHSCQVEYYWNKLGVGQNDPQRPHDIAGAGSKYTWPVIRGLAMQYRTTDPDFFEKILLPSIQYHRQQQYHHQKWNPTIANPDPEDMKAGAIDALCSRLDGRLYQASADTIEDVMKCIKTEEDPKKRKWMLTMYEKMKSIRAPQLGRIKNLIKIPNIGLPKKTHDEITGLTLETVMRLSEEQGYGDLYELALKRQ